MTASRYNRLHLSAALVVLAALSACRSGLPADPPAADPGNASAGIPAYDPPANPYKTSAFAGAPASASGGAATPGPAKPAPVDHSAHTGKAGPAANGTAPRR